MKIYVNYMREDGEKGSDLCTNVTIDETEENIMHFDWTITGHLSATYGPIVFLVCIQKVASDGTSANHWNSELCKDMHVSEGLEVESFVASVYPGIITALLTRMDDVDSRTSNETMVGYVEDFIESKPDVVQTVVCEYLDENGEDYIAGFMRTDQDVKNAITESVNNYMSVNYDYFSLVSTAYRSDIPAGQLNRTISRNALANNNIEIGSSFRIVDYLVEADGYYVYTGNVEANNLIDFTNGVLPEGIPASEISMIVVSNGVVIDLVSKEHMEQYKAYHFTEDSTFYITGVTPDFVEEDVIIFKIRKYTDFSALGGGNTPVKGTDYWTDDDKAEIKSYVDEAILGGAW